MTFLPGFKQVLSRDGWIDLEEYYEILKHTSQEVLTISKGHCLFSCPKSFSSTPFNGILVEITTDTSRVILKPSVKLLNKEVQDIKQGDQIARFFSFQTVIKSELVLWEGDQYSLYFGSPVFLPVKFENDYILIPT